MLPVPRRPMAMWFKASAHSNPIAFFPTSPLLSSPNPSPPLPSCASLLVQRASVPPAPSWWRASRPAAASQRSSSGGPLASASLVVARAGREEEQALQEAAKVAGVMWRERKERRERREWDEGTGFFLALCASGYSVSATEWIGVSLRESCYTLCAMLCTCVGAPCRVSISRKC